jgi:hypothetical protein
VKDVGYDEFYYEEIKEDEMGGTCNTQEEMSQKI